MHTLKLSFKVFLAALALAFIAGCGKETVPYAAPIVVSTVPTNGAVGVPINQVVSATFSATMNPATITAASFTLTAGGAAIAGDVFRVIL